jgi:hypothetical protein
VTSLKRFLVFVLSLFVLYIVASVLISIIVGIVASIQGQAGNVKETWAIGAPAAERFFREYAVEMWLGSLVTAAAAIYRWNGLGIGILVAFVIWFALKGMPSPERVDDSPTILSTPAPDTPVATATPPPATGTPQQRALQAYPDLGVANSPLNREFLRRHTQYKNENPHYFDDPEWPTKLAKESSDALANP